MLPNSLVRGVTPSIRIRMSWYKIQAVAMNLYNRSTTAAIFIGLTILFEMKLCARRMNAVSHILAAFHEEQADKSNCHTNRRHVEQDRVIKDINHKSE